MALAVGFGIFNGDVKVVESERLEESCFADH